MINFMVVFLIFEGYLANHFEILIENKVRCMFRAQITSPESASLFSSGRTSNGRSQKLQIFNSLFVLEVFPSLKQRICYKLTIR